jgi:hypothetical protein
MKGIPKVNKKYLLMFFLIISITFLSGCGGVTPTEPIINSFTADSTTIDEGESVTLSWVVTDATTASINQGIGTVTVPSGSTTVPPPIPSLPPTVLGQVRPQSPFP